MHLTSGEHRQEAARLLALDEQSLELEAVALALRIGESSERSMKELEEIDRGFIRLLDGRYGEGNPSAEGSLEGPDVEHLGARHGGTHEDPS